MGMM
jgi:hypothetical protein